MQAGKHMGKVVVRVDEKDMVPAVPRTPKVNVSSEATYVMAGLGGICREIGRWLAEKGARSLISFFFCRGRWPVARATSASPRS